MDLPSTSPCPGCDGSGRLDLRRVIDRLRDRSVVTDRGCWEYQADATYPKVLEHFVTLPVHQLAFLAAHGYLPAMVTHECDNSRCWNPDHLREGDALSNNRERRERRARLIPLGHGRSTKLTEGNVARIREVQESGGGILRNADARALAKEFGVHVNTIRRAATGHSWRSDTRSVPAPRAHWRERGIAPAFPSQAGVPRAKKVV